MRLLRHLPILCVLPALPASALTDSNTNGISDLWEREYNNQQLFPATSDPEEDADGDGASNSAEATAGTNPFDGKPPEGYFAAEVTHIPTVYLEVGGETEILTPEAFVVTWPTFSGKRYTLLVSPDLAAGNWTPIEESIPGNGSTVQIAINPQQEGGGIPEKLFWRVSVNDVDTDGDGFNDWEESVKGTNSLIADRDDDGLPDDWEALHGFDPNDDGSTIPQNGPDADPDNDGLSNFLEYSFSGHPHDSDTDNDGLTDFQEAMLYGTSLDSSDTDGDSLSDKVEIQIHQTNPLSSDSDGDSLADSIELNVHHTNPLSNDTDGDTLRDFWEISNGLDPLVPNSLSDPDGDGLKNVSEQLLKLNPLSSDTDADGIPDGSEDPDKDTLANLAEINNYSTNPQRKDTDGDGIPDNWEIDNGLDPTSSAAPNGTTHDPDHDDLPNYQEWLNYADPHDSDSDNDGVNDGVEVGQGSDPLIADFNEMLTSRILEVQFQVGDPSTSKSEKWKLEIKGLGPHDTRNLAVASPSYGVSANMTLKLHKWNRYEITIQHDGTDPNFLASPQNQPDYDWEAMIDGKPDGTSTEEIQESGALNWFMVKNHWLVDNREAILTKIQLGSGEDSASGKKAYLIPVAIKDNIDATGVDSVSVTAYPSSSGYQEKSWIMAPSGGEEYNNDMHFKIPLAPATDLRIHSELVTAAPETAPLEVADPSPVVNWRATDPDSIDESPAWKLGTSKQQADLPIGVKRMKKRTVNVICYVIRRPGSNITITPVAATALESALNRTFGYQINAYFNVTVKPGISETDYDLDHDLWIDPQNADATTSSEAMEIINNNRDPSGDIHVYYSDLHIALSDYPPNDHPSTPGNILALSPNKPLNGDISAENNIFVSPRKFPHTSDAIMSHIIAHEAGHVLVGPGHPDQLTGPAPLEGTNTMQRLMNSTPADHPNSFLLTKTEWDRAEIWLKEVPDKRVSPNGENTGNY